MQLVEVSSCERRIFRLVKDARANLFEIAQASCELLFDSDYAKSRRGMAFKKKIDDYLVATTPFSMWDLALMANVCKSKSEWVKKSSDELYALLREAWNKHPDVVRRLSPKAIKRKANRESLANKRPTEPTEPIHDDSLNGCSRNSIDGLVVPEIVRVFIESDQSERATLVASKVFRDFREANPDLF